MKAIEEEGKNGGSAFSKIQHAPELEQFHKSLKYMGDPFPRKVNLTVGAYRDENGNPYVLPVVRKAKSLLADQGSQIDDDDKAFGAFGYEPFIQAAIELLLGKNSAAIDEERILGVQCLSGTGALRLGGEFLCQILAKDTIYFPDPTWNGHECIFKGAGFSNVRNYRYYDRENRLLDFDGMLQDLVEAEENSVILLQACAHNPTGLDLNKEQWKKVAFIVKERQLLTFFDIAYPGFVSGDPEEDAWAIRYFAEQGIEFLAMQTFAKNLGLYNERIGALTIVFSRSNEEMIKKVRSTLEPIIHGLWANPPLHGARIVQSVLATPELRTEWLETLKQMARRLREVRKALRDCLEENGAPPGSWVHIVQQGGFFSFTGLTASQVAYLEHKLHVYMLADGRINICGLNEHNVPYVSAAIKDAIQNSK